MNQTALCVYVLLGGGVFWSTPLFAQGLDSWERVDVVVPLRTLGSHFSVELPRILSVFQTIPFNEPNESKIKVNGHVS
jgi:hypothetical protein